MPELPEVETVVRTLENRIKGQTIKEVKVYWNNIIAYPSVSEFEKKLIGQSFVSFFRRGKYLIFELNDYFLIAHLRMEGKFYIYAATQEKSKHDHVIFALDNCYVHYNDTRKFGKFYLYRKDEPLEAISKLGKEPFDETLTGEYLKQFNKKNTQYIKTQLLNQEMIAGIGNIYADEILFATHLNPKLRSCFLSIDKWNEVIRETRRILNNAIEAGGTTIRSYTSSLGVTGRFQLSLKVHSQENKPCYDCGAIIKKITLNTRGCNYCEVCQANKPIKVAITGSIGCGKSTVTSLVEKMGYHTISCDAINHELLEEKEVKEKISEILNCDVNLINRKYIASRIYSDNKLKKKIESYLHKLIYQKILEFFEIYQNEKVLFVEVPLLFETEYYKHFDFNILVKTDETKLIERLIRERKMSEKDALTILSNQMSQKEKEEKCDLVIDNNSSLQVLTNTVEKKINDIMKLI